MLVHRNRTLFLLIFGAIALIAIAIFLYYRDRPIDDFTPEEASIALVEKCKAIGKDLPDCPNYLTAREEFVSRQLHERALERINRDSQIFFGMLVALPIAGGLVIFGGLYLRKKGASTIFYGLIIISGALIFLFSIWWILFFALMD